MYYSIFAGAFIVVILLLLWNEYRKQKSTGTIHQAVLLLYVVASLAYPVYLFASVKYARTVAVSPAVLQKMVAYGDNVSGGQYVPSDLKIEVLTKGHVEALIAAESLSLDAPKRMTDDAAVLLGSIQSTERPLEGIQEMNETGQWVPVDSVTLVNDSIRFNGITELTSTQARALAQFTGIISLDGLTDISPEVAEALANHTTGNLQLNGVTALETRAGQALARHPGTVECGITDAD